MDILPNMKKDFFGRRVNDDQFFCVSGRTPLSVFFTLGSLYLHSAAVGSVSLWRALTSRQMKDTLMTV